MTLRPYPIAKRAFDIVAAGAATLVLAPVVAIAALGVKLSSRGPVFYRSERMGRHGRPFTILKIRTMRVGTAGASAITAAGDNRVFAFGRVLRACKIDELPQLWNVLNGDMTIVGPRPEAVSIVEDHYGPEHMRTLDIRPGLASPGSLWGTTHGEQMIGTDHPERDYVVNVLPVKMALELHYLEHQSFALDLSVIARTIRLVTAQLTGKGDALAPPPELDDATRHHRHDAVLGPLADS